MPLAGVPITITRVYDTLQADTAGDFGYGWSLKAYDARIREALPVTDGPGNPFGATPFRAGTRVYMNTPDGRRVGFTFRPTVEGTLLGALWRPKFVADAGVFETLTVADTPLGQGADGTFGVYLFGTPWNPSEYTLTTKDGLAYRYDQFDGLRDVTDRNGVSVRWSFQLPTIFLAWQVSTLLPSSTTGRPRPGGDPRGAATWTSGWSGSWTPARSPTGG